jgi:phosphoglycolate phosphatase-like HAD superfamily hydrolase
MLRHIRLLVFDLDYVIFDCSALKIRALRQSLISFADAIPQDLRLPDAMDAEEGFRDHGFRWTQFVEIGLSEERLSELQQVYRIQEDRLLEAGVGQIYPKLQEFLEACRRSGLSLALGAESSRDYLLAVSDRLGLDRIFQISLCTEEFGVGSADEMLEEVMHYNEVNASETLVLGTRPALFQSAHNLDLVTVGCGWGLHQHDRLGEADFQAPTLERLIAVLQEADRVAAGYSA